MATSLDEITNRVTHIEAQLPSLASKHDLAEAKADLIKWIVGTALAMGAAAITVMTFVLNNAVPKQSIPSSPPAPIIIQVPSGQPPQANK